jgi:hypothetical protein
LLRIGLGSALAASFLSPEGRADAPAGRYTLAGNGTVYDTQTGLTWQQSDDGVDRNWNAAVSYCQTLPLAGGGWRLPQVKELLSILDLSRSNPALDRVAFPGAANTSYWSASDQVGQTDAIWFVYFVYGNMSWTGVTDIYRVRCVR